MFFITTDDCGLFVGGTGRGVIRTSFVAQWRDAAAAQCATCIDIDYLQENQDTQNFENEKQWYFWKSFIAKARLIGIFKI